MKRCIKSNSKIADLVESKLNDWIDQGQGDVDIDDAIVDLGGDESTIDELRRRGRIDKNGHYVYLLTSAEKVPAGSISDDYIDEVDEISKEAIAFAEAHKDEVIFRAVKPRSFSFVDVRLQTKPA